MLKYLNTAVVFEEIPDEVSLAINITNCQNRCIGCHSPELRGNIGAELTKEETDKLLKDNQGVTCVIFMGEGNDGDAFKEIAEYIKNIHGLKVAVYSGREEENIEPWIWGLFDYVKVGPYKKEFGPLNDRSTNQRLYYMDNGTPVDITSRFWRKAE